MKPLAMTAWPVQMNPLTGKTQTAFYNQIVRNYTRTMARNYVKGFTLLWGFGLWLLSSLPYSSHML